MRFGILGPTQVRSADGREVPVGGPRLRALLARLLLDPGRVVGTDRLIDDLYGGQPPAGAANALQSQVSRLRRTLSAAGSPAAQDWSAPPDGLAAKDQPTAQDQPVAQGEQAAQRRPTAQGELASGGGPAAVVELHPGGYRLAVDPELVDAHRFARLAAEGGRALAAGDPQTASARLTEALALWRGPALADVADAPFVPAYAVRWEEQRLAATEDRVEAELALGESGALVPDLQALVVAHPLRERLRGQLMRALAGSGRQAEALTAFEEARQTLADELGADPSPALAAVHLTLLRGEEQPVGPLLRRPPSQLTRFVGREEELRRVGKLLAEARLVTVTGPGGAGKTRLAIEAAGRAGDDACFVELAPLSDGADVPFVVLSAMGLRDAGLRASTESRADPTERLIAALDQRPVLLLLDNCEHVVDAAARLADRLLRVCPGVRILATSREPLGLTGEVQYPLSGLARPPADTPPERAWEYPAIRMFADRAAELAPELGPSDLAPVREICEALDGLPLAIELAAARLRSLPVAEVAARLDDRFRLLSRGSRTADPRHQTLRAVVEWSWGLLDATEQALARRLSVFAGGAGLDAVAQVTGDGLDPLASLVDKSLVERIGDRYRMLETVRAFAAERLAEAGETDRLRRAHMAYFLHLARTADPQLRTAPQLTWLATLDAERDNLHAALRWARSGAPATALELVAALSFYWWLRGLRSEAAAMAGEVLVAVGPHAPPGLVEEHAVCVLTALLHGGAGDADRAALVASAAAVVYSADLAPVRQPFLYYLAGMATGPPEGGPDEVATLVDRGNLLIADDPWAAALAGVGHGLAYSLVGEVSAAVESLTGAVARFRALGERWGMMTALSHLAELVDRSGDPARAVGLMDEALQLAGELGSTVDLADLLVMRAGGRLRGEDPAAARSDYRRAVELARRAGAPELVAAGQLGLAEAARLGGDLAGARRWAEAALAACPTGWYVADETRAEILALLARLEG